MGRFKVKFKVCSIREPDKCKEVEGLVDTGATISVIPKRILEAIGIEPRREEEFKLADGRVIRRKVGIAEIRLMVDGEEKDTGARIIFGEDGDEAILGVTVLEQLGLKVDPVDKRIIKDIAHI